MEAVVIARGGGISSAPRDRIRERSPRIAGWIVLIVLSALAAGIVFPAAAQGPPAGDETRSSGSGSSQASAPPEVAIDASRLPRLGALTTPDQAPAQPSPPKETEPRRYRVRDEAGNCVVARLHGQHGDKAVLLQPDGQLGFPNMLVPTDEPFVPLSANELSDRLKAGPYKGFEVLPTPHYLIFYKSRPAFAQDSGKLLESLYRGLIDFCHRHELPVHESEFPLVAVIFATEKDFRAYKPVAPEVQAYYEIFPNRIFFYEESNHDQHEPKLLALRKPQTVAHEGAHQILANIGVQPRLSAWPLWLIEGFAEFCATPGRNRKGLTYDRFGAINPLHMATLRELDDPLSEAMVDETGQRTAPAPARSSRLLDTEGLIAKKRLTPTDYAQSWALTHYLTQKSPREFGRYLRTMSQMPPLEPRTPEQHLSDFRKYFGDDPAKLDRKVEDYIRKLTQKGNFIALPYYAVIFQRPLGGGMVRRQAWISQSPQVIQRWVEQTIASEGGMYNWDVVEFPTRARAELAAENWVRGY